jgi:hypothetical protein
VLVDWEISVRGRDVRTVFQRLEQRRSVVSVGGGAGSGVLVYGLVESCGERGKGYVLCWWIFFVWLGFRLGEGGQGREVWDWWLWIPRYRQGSRGACCADFGEGFGVLARLERDRKTEFVENDGGTDGHSEFARVHSVSELGVVAKGTASVAVCGR